MAARETGALKEAKDKLEKKVEELTWRLELVEKRMWKLKGRKLQSYKVKLDEAHEAMTKEMEGARIAIEQAPPITKEVLVEENSMLELLTTRNKELEDELRKLKSKAQEFEERYIKEFCSFSNDEFIKDGLQDLEQWCSKTIEQLAGIAWEQLQHIRHAVEFLVLHQKFQKPLEEIRNEICPVLSVPQIYRIGTMFWDDKYGGTKGLSQENDIEDGDTCH
ncbi:hypothetical protein Cni_G06409 [Canna indica]|uniref:Dilute domain-containing protein n=1 Tax=Canna indica TaxID=4628 RepID=A0AAQ3JX76_9LILI|nr:hypothetical protein Cni_G06409 [Canna indica]